MDDDWGDLFAAAAGATSKLTTTVEKEVNKPKKKRKINKQVNPDQILTGLCDSIYQSRNSELSDSTNIPLTIPDLPKSYSTSKIRTLLSIFHSNYPKNKLSQLNRLDSLYYELYYISISDKQETGEGFTRDGWARDLIDYHCLKRGRDVLKIIWKFRNDEISSFRACFRESEDWNINNIKPPLSVTDNDSVDYNKHKVYAPPTILEYYEISRTWLCHIYGYYSLPSKSLKYIKSVHYTKKKIKKSWM